MGADIHGRRAIGRNILTNWVSQLVQLVSGFIVPRLINDRLSIEALGVWDFAWSLVVYFSLVQMGVTTSINRYVAFYRSRNDIEGVNRAVSSVAMIMRGMSGVILLLTAILSFGISGIFEQRLGSHSREAQWLVFLLGVDVAIQVSAAVYAGVLTGSHRWDWHNGVQSGASVITLLGMMMVLELGYGLVALAVVILLVETVGRSVRAYAAYRVCPWLEIRWQNARWRTALDMMTFGGKSSATNVSQLLMNAIVSVMVGVHLGPAALALYSRPFALVRNLGVFVNKYSMVFSPTISSLQGAGQIGEVRQLTIKATRYGLFLLLPVALVLIVFGDEILRIWMGRAFASHLLVAALMLGFFHQIAYIPVLKTLAGMNLHGRPGVVNVLGAVAAVGGVFLMLYTGDLSLTGVAVAVGLPMTVVNGVYLPIYACRQLSISLPMFYKEVWGIPLLCAAPFGVCLWMGRLCFVESSLLRLIYGGTLGVLILAACYWNVAVPELWKRRIRCAGSFGCKSPRNCQAAEK